MGHKRSQGDNNRGAALIIRSVLDILRARVFAIACDADDLDQHAMTNATLAQPSPQ